MTLRVGQVHERTGLSPRQLREWERRGLVRPRRGVGNQRVYGEADLALLRQAKRLRDAGLDLAQVKLALSVANGSTLGGDLEGIAALRSVLARMAAQLAVAEELAVALAARLSRRGPR